MKQIADKQRIFLPCLLIIGMVVLCLLISHPYNFVPILSCLMFFGAVRPRQEYVIPLLALIGTDILLTEIQYAYPLTADAVLTWLWYLVAMVFGADKRKVRNRWNRSDSAFRLSWATT